MSQEFIFYSNTRYIWEPWVNYYFFHMLSVKNLKCYLRKLNIIYLKKFIMLISNLTYEFYINSFDINCYKIIIMEKKSIHWWDCNQMTKWLAFSVHSFIN